jgi:hypothetical protein
MLVKLNILNNTNNVYIYSFLDPAAEYATSVCSNLIKGSGTTNGFNSYIDPKKIFINKRLVSNGFSLEKLGDKFFKTQSFLSLGRECVFKKIGTIKSEIVRTDVPYIPTALILGFWSNLKANLEKPNMINCGFFQLKLHKIWTIAQLFSKSNYVYVYKIVTENEPRKKFLSGEM